MRRLLTSLPLLLAFVAGPASASELLLGAGLGKGSLTANQIPIALQYDWLLCDGAMLLVIRSDLDLNADRPYGQLMRGAELGLGVGLEWQSAPADRVRMVAGGLLGPVLYIRPGAGLAARAVVGARIPLSGPRLWLAVEASGVAAVATIGDETRHDESIVQADLILGIGAQL